MKKNIANFYLFLSALILSAGIGFYWYSQGLAMFTVFNAAAATLIAALPFPYILGKILPFAKGARQAQKSDIKLNDSSQLEDIGNIDTLILGRHGIITEGHPYVASLYPAGVSQNVLLSLAASAEKDATHPLGQAIYETASQRGLQLLEASTFTEVPGCGVEAIVGRNSLRVGSIFWLKKEGIDISADLITKNDQLAQRGHSTVFVANGKYCRGIIAIDDALDQDTLTAIRKLQRQHLHVVMLTRENKRTVETIGKQAGLDSVHGQLTLEGKLREIQLLKARGTGVAIVERGKIPDELCQAVDAVIELAPARHPLDKETGLPPATQENPQAIFLQSGLLWDFAVLQEIGRSTLNRIKLNKMIALIAFAVMLPLSAGALYPFGIPFLPAWGALAGQALTLLLVTINSLR
ncbi:Cu+-exporting ATPase [Selenomonas ruminantium]|uniref:Cu+-exporting ATPase n=1 Tax=Selenomonas ruminantium TaxID=971 RepID=A0A1M6R6H7_SELRU|nr:HAD family hydrolase [Selenomonas ruminantium]SHK28062.1 Cu+-exporting ATPase [Selenomonas ruminantium]